MATVNNIIKSNSFVSLSDQAIVSGSNFLSNILLARMLGIEVFGEFSFIWLFILFASGFQSAIIIAPMQSLDFSKNSQTNISKSTTMWFLSALILFLLILVAIVFYKFIGENINLPLVLILLNLICFLWNEYLRKLFFAIKKPFFSLRLDILSYGSQISFLVLFWHFDTITLETGLFAILISNLISGTYGIVKHPAISIRKNEILDVSKFFFHNGKWLLGTSILQWFSGNWFLVLAASVLSPIAIGAVRIVQNILGVSHVVFLAMENFVPVNSAAAYREGGSSLMFTYMKKITIKSALLIFPAFLFLFFFNKEIILMLYGNEYIHQAGLLRIFVVLYILVFIGTLFRFVIRAENKTQIIFISYIITSVFGLLCANIFLKTWDANGIVYGMIGSQLLTISCFVVYYFSPKLMYLWK